LGAVYSNGEPDPLAILPGTQCDPYYDPPWAAGIADDFVLPGTDPVNIASVIAWMGHYWDYTPIATPADYEGVMVTIYANNPDSTPNEPAGKPIDGDADCAHTDIIAGGVVYSINVTTFTYVEEAPGSDIWRLDMPVDVTLDGGVTYWLEVAPILDYNTYGQSAWWPTSILTGNSSMQIFESLDLTEWEALDEDMAFCLQALPTGACCVVEECVATNTEAQCTALTGTWYGGENCSEFECPALGACCVVEECVATNTEAQCTALTGTWYEGENCSEFECPATGACCVDELCVATNTEAQCLTLTGTWHEGETCPEFDCSGPSCYEYLPGDVNMSVGNWPPAASGQDVTYLVNRFRGLPTSVPCFLDGDLGLFWASADANGDCQIIGSDVTKLVNVFRNIGSITWCGEDEEDTGYYEPCWPTPLQIPAVRPAGWPYCETSTTVTGKGVTETPKIDEK
jgi:hypothetical protein